MLNRSSCSIEEDEQIKQFSFQDDKHHNSNSCNSSDQNNSFQSESSRFDSIRLIDSFELIKDIIKKNQNKQKQNVIQSQQQQKLQQRKKHQFISVTKKQSNHKIKPVDLSSFNEMFNNQYSNQVKLVMDDEQENKCRYCNQSMNYNLLKIHEQQCNLNEDNFDEINCPYCGDIIIRAFINDHFQDCNQYLEDQFKKLDGIEDCSICVSEINQQKLTLNCQHSFHSECIKDWLLKKMECPVCREKVLQ